jgi:hypothetical protein
MKNSGPFRLKAGEFRDRAQTAESPLARQRMEDAAKRFESLADEIDGAAEPPRRENRAH